MFAHIARCETLCAVNGHGNYPIQQRHAAERWVQRVDRGASVHEANLPVRRFVAMGRARPTSRHWMRGRVRPEPGTPFVYNACRPGLCAVVVDGLVVTILTRSLFAARPRHFAPVPTALGPIPAGERAKSRWSGEVVDLGDAA